METGIQSSKVLKIKKNRISLRLLYEQKYLILMSLPFVIWAFIFRYLPLWGWTMAFQNYKPGKSFSEQKWVGLQQFTTLFKEPDFYLALRNTLAMSILGFILNFTIPIIFALLLNELRLIVFKKTIQTISYLPHFISWVIAASLVSTMLSTDNGLVNEILVNLHLIKEPIQFMAMPKLFWWVVVLADLWKEMGWNTIIYLAAIAGIDMQLYEAAKIDGAGRIKRMFNVTLPSIRSTIVVILVMNVGWLLNIGLERQMLLGNAVVQDYSLVIDLYALNYGLAVGRYSFGTAIGIFKSVISVILVLFANKVAKRIGDGQII